MEATKADRADPQRAEVHNHTPWSLAEIETSFPYLGRTVNNWRGRGVALYAHPSDQTALVSVGVTFNGLMTVVAVEPRSDWTTALDYIQHGKVYVSE